MVKGPVLSRISYTGGIAMTIAHCSRRWCQLSLKSLFLLTLVVAAFFAGYSLATKRAEEVMRAEQEARKGAEESARVAERRLKLWAGFDSGVDDHIMEP